MNHLVKMTGCGLVLFALHGAWSARVRLNYNWCDSYEFARSGVSLRLKVSL